jgi:hypothetical protein
VTPPATAGGELRFEQAVVLVPRLAEARAQVDEAGRDDDALRVERALGA